MEISKTTLNRKENILSNKKESTIFDLIKQSKKQFELALPKHFDSERFTRIAITTIRQNEKLLKCKTQSLLGALMTSAQLGLEPGILGQAYLIPYGNECQFQISYKGMIELLRRSGQLKDIYTYTVYENDDFEIVYGLERDLKHKPNSFDNRGEEIGYYAVAVLKDDTKSFIYMTKAEVENHAKKFSKAIGYIWKTDFEAMAHKTVIKKLLKYLPLSVEFIENTYKDEKIYNLNEETKETEEIIVDPKDEIEEVEVIEAEEKGVENE